MANDPTPEWLIWITDGLIIESDDVLNTSETSITVENGFTKSYLVADSAHVFSDYSDYSNEPEPNGGRINMGAYGGTAEATPTNNCEGDFDNDKDVDGSDLAVSAADFGRTDCSGDCEGNFDSDGDVDGSDLAVFAADFGRTDCP